jgi:hypothetical protein
LPIVIAIIPRVLETEAKVLPSLSHHPKKSQVVTEDRDCHAEKGQETRENKGEKGGLNNANASCGSPPVGCCRLHPSLNAVTMNNRGKIRTMQHPVAW